jgi:septal ring factor EnvC (AmiA/AmiB activator)
MAPRKFWSPAPASGTTGHAAQHGADMLWQHQLRKESAALLERLDECNRRIEIVNSETNKKLQDAAERISTLEAKLSKIDSEGKKIKEAKEKWDADLAALKTQMGIISESRTSESKLIAGKTMQLLRADQYSPSYVQRTRVFDHLS